MADTPQGIAYSDAVEELLKRFPEFREWEGFDPDELDLPYCQFGDFARIATTRMRRIPAENLDDDPFVIRVFDFANDLMDSDDDETQNLTVVEFFENFYMYQKTLELSRRKLKNAHLADLERLSYLLGTSDLHYEGELIAPQGLDPLAAIFSECSWKIRVRRYDPDEPPYFEANDPRIKLTMDSGIGPKYTFFGAAHLTDYTAGNLSAVLLGELSQALTSADVAHRIQLFRSGTEDDLLNTFQHRWPSKDAAVS